LSSLRCPFDAALHAAKTLNLTGKVVVDMTNPVTADYSEDSPADEIHVGLQRKSDHYRAGRPVEKYHFAIIGGETRPRPGDQEMSRAAEIVVDEVLGLTLKSGAMRFSRSAVILHLQVGLGPSLKGHSLARTPVVGRRGTSPRALQSRQSQRRRRTILGILQSSRNRQGYRWQ
jgi:hypothetical protein